MEKIQEPKRTLFVSENLLIEAFHQDGKLLGARGEKVKAQTIEMNHVKIEKPHSTFFLPLSEDVRWMELEL